MAIVLSKLRIALNKAEIDFSELQLKSLFETLNEKANKKESIVGDIHIMNCSLMTARTKIGHQGVFMVNSTDKTPYAHLQKWADAAERVCSFYNTGKWVNKDAAYLEYCLVALDMMGKRYSLNGISSYADKIEMVFKQTWDIANDPYKDTTKLMFDAYAREFKLGNHAISVMKKDDNYINFVNFVSVTLNQNIDCYDYLMYHIGNAKAINMTLEVKFLSFDSNILKYLATKDKKPSGTSFFDNLNKRL
jgi:hypothetical protein